MSPFTFGSKCLDYLMAFERLPRKKERGTPKFLVRQLQQATVIQIVPFLQQTLAPEDVPKSLSESLAKHNTHCGYYALYFLYSLQQLDVNSVLDGARAGSLPLPLKLVVDRAAFCVFFEDRLKRQLQARGSVTNLGIPELARLATDFTSPVTLICVPVFELVEDGDAALVEAWQAEYPTLKPDLERIDRFRRDSAAPLLHLLLLEAKWEIPDGQENNKQAWRLCSEEHWIGVYVTKQGGRLVLLCGDSYHPKPDPEILDSLVTYLCRKQQ